MSAKTARVVDRTFLRRPWTDSANRQRRYVAGLLLLAVGLFAAAAFPLVGGAGQARAAQGNDPAAVVEAYIAAVNAEDLAGILALYADDAVHVALPTADGSAGVCIGKEQFRLFYEQGIANKDELEVVDGTLTVAEDRVTFVARMASDPWRELGIEALEGNAEAVIEDGRIAAHVVMLTPESVRELLTAFGTIPTPTGSEQQSAPGPHHPRNVR